MARGRVGTIQLAGASTRLDAGVTFVAAPGTQIDFAVTHGLSDSAPAFQAGLGLSSSFQDVRSAPRKPRRLSIRPPTKKSGRRHP